MYPYISILGDRLYSYSFFSILGMVVSIILTSKLLAKRMLSRKYMNYIMCSMLGMVAMAKFFGIVSKMIYEYSVYGKFNLQSCVKNSGIVFWGGLIGFLLTLKILCRKDRSLQEIGNILAVSIPLFHCFGRVGCYFAGCCYGVESNSRLTLPYRIGFEEEWSNRLPVQLWEAGFELLLFSINLKIYKKKVEEGNWNDGKLMMNYLAGYSCWRFVIEFFRGDVERGRIGILSFSQVVCVLMIIFIWSKWVKRRTEEKMNKLFGIIKGIFYGIVVSICFGFIQCSVALVSCSDMNEGVTKIFFIVCIIGGAIIGLCTGADEDNKMEEAAKRRERETMEQERNENFKRWISELAGKYDWIYSHYNDCNSKGIIMSEAECLHGSIWSVEKNLVTNGYDRYRVEYEKRWNNHRNWLRNKAVEITNTDGVYYLRSSLNALIILKDSYNGDDGFAPAINALRDVMEKVQNIMFYISQEEYGRIIFPLQEDEEQVKLERLVTNIEEKISKQNSIMKNDMNGYFAGMAECLTEDYIREIASLMWYYAWKKPFDVQKFSMAENAFNKFTLWYKDGVRVSQVESVLARIYAKNQIGGMGTVRSELEYMNTWLDAQIYWNEVKRCCALASGLAWMDLYELEREVLRKLVAAGLQLPEDVQERLSFLESGGTSDVKLYRDVPKDKFYFDSSATEWKATEYDVFFRKAAMKKVVLDYSLAISKWTKTLPLVSGQKVDFKEIYAEFEKMVLDFDGTVACEKVEAQAINLENLEYEDAVLFRFSGKRSRCVSMLFASEKYGKNLNITILTLFTPEDGIGYEELQKYAMAINENVYVESFKESILQSVDEVIKVKKTVYEEEPVRKVFE